MGRDVKSRGRRKLKIRYTHGALLGALMLLAA